MCHVQFLEKDFDLNAPRGESRTKELNSVWTILKNYFLNF